MEDVVISTQKQQKVRINQQITAAQIRVIDDAGEQVGILSRFDALRKAEEAGLDLVEISPNAKPPVARIMDFGKYLFEMKKGKKKQKVVKLKEIKMRPVTEEEDYQVKLRNLRSFLEKGNKVKVTIRFRGREITHQDLGLKLLERMKKDLEDLGQVEQMPKLEGRQMIMMLAPQKKSS